MDAEQRRNTILNRLENADGPLSASALAAVFSVSRQIIVGDVALLRASGHEISSTPRGYRLAKPSGRLVRRIACRHDDAATRAELCAIVDEGCTVKDVIVEHPIYGQLTGQLGLSSRYDIEKYVISTLSKSARPLSLLTDGAHFHTLLCPNEAAFERVKDRLRTMGVLTE
ncbi:MAG: transcription repressor NadR [Stomatobaculum sp.]|nr:transcription repressor NadR [Stomatobaculum sp.]